MTALDKASDEQALLTALRKRDAAALTTLFEAYSNPLYRLAVGLLHDDQAAEDVVQSAFVTLIQHIGHFDGRASIRTWLYRVAYNDCLQRLRGPVVVEDVDAWDEAEFMPPTLIDWGALPEAIVSGAEAQAQMLHAIGRLTPALRAVFTLRDIEGLSVRETAESLGLSEAAVKVNLHRARLSLREQLTGYFDERVRG
ncbi:MAG TPA: sigma-70 family RNA polymerase sigma factor [Candidatus Limnocylindrales bacterium]|nr:sigma-70 family RNA polymerase sigma factor [Candidatus Limnocylindrales bacterium]